MQFILIPNPIIKANPILESPNLTCNYGGPTPLKPTVAHVVFPIRLLMSRVGLWVCLCVCLCRRFVWSERTNSKIRPLLQSCCCASSTPKSLRI